VSTSQKKKLEELHADLKNKQIIQHQTGIFQKADHYNLLNECRCFAKSNTSRSSSTELQLKKIKRKKK
jgi:hypothetical protein